MTKNRYKEPCMVFKIFLNSRYNFPSRLVQQCWKVLAQHKLLFPIYQESATQKAHFRQNSSHRPQPWAPGENHFGLEVGPALSFLSLAPTEGQVLLAAPSRFPLGIKREQ